MQMGSWCSNCYHYCCGEVGEINLQSHLLDSQRVTTIRRISSVGITVVSDDGEEKEIPRHSSILQSYNGVTVPWSSIPLSVQPGVTKEDVACRVKALPTISETPPVKQKSRGWRRAIGGSKGELSLERKARDNDKPKGNDIQLTLFRKVTDNVVSASQDDILSRRSSPNDSAWQPLRRPSYSSSPNLFAMKTSDKSSQHLLPLAHCARINSDESEQKRSSWLESQSLEEISLEEESEASKLAKRHGLNLSLYCQHDVKEPTCPVEEPLQFWAERSYGTVDVIVSLDSLQKLLTVTIDGIRGLSGSGPQRLVYPVLYKISVLNDKKNIKTGRKLDGSSNIKVNQTYLFHVRDINSRGFRITVFNSEFLGRHDAIGHALFNFRDATKDPKSFPLKIERRSTLESCSAVVEVKAYLKDTLNITVVRVKNIPKQYQHGRLYVKQSYFSLSKKTKERVSSVCWKEESSDVIVFDHSAKFKIDPSGQKHSYVAISLKVCSSKLAFRKSDKTVGRMYLGPCFHHEDGTLTPWGKVVLRTEQFAGSFQMYS